MMEWRLVKGEAKQKTWLGDEPDLFLFIDLIGSYIYL